MLIVLRLRRQRPTLKLPKPAFRNFRLMSVSLIKLPNIGVHILMNYYSIRILYDLACLLDGNYFAHIILHYLIFLVIRYLTLMSEVVIELFFGVDYVSTVIEL